MVWGTGENYRERGIYLGSFRYAAKTEAIIDGFPNGDLNFREFSKDVREVKLRKEAFSATDDCGFGGRD